MVRPMATARSFSFEKCLGSGAFGEVYLCTMISANGVRSNVAVKVLHADINAAGQAVQRLKDEGRMLGLLNHPCIVGGTDLVVFAGRVALITEYVEGADLAVCIEENPPIPLVPLLDVIGDVAAALDAAWKTPGPDGAALELVHRDVKPHNIRVGRHGEVKLLDFGVARASIEREAITMADTVVGSTLYMAPERFDKKNPVTPHSDVYSLGLTMYEGLARKAFFGAMPVNQQFFLAVEDTSHDEYRDQALADLDEIPEGVLKLLRDMLAHDQTQRPTAGGVVRRCETLSDRLEGVNLRKWCRRRRWNEPPPVPGGKLVGKTLDEDGKELVHVVPEAPEQPVPSGRGQGISAFLALGGGVAVGLFAAAVLIGLAAVIVSML
jgi:serine/threonine-protein kinase